jgi:hypothetical protein
MLVHIANASFLFEELHQVFSMQQSEAFELLTYLG